MFLVKILISYNHLEKQVIPQGEIWWKLSTVWKKRMETIVQWGTVCPRGTGRCRGLIWRTDDSQLQSGSRFTSNKYKQLLKHMHIRQSMDGKSRWSDNIKRGVAGSSIGKDKSGVFFRDTSVQK